MSIKNTLKKLEFSDKEILVYLALLRNGKTKPSTLATITKLNRATLYNIAKNLISKGVVAEDISSKVLHYTPLPIESLNKLTDHAKREIKEKESLIKTAINDLGLITTDKSYPVPKIRFIEENNLEKFLFDNTTKWQQAVIDSDGIWWGYQDNSFAENFEKWIHATWQTDLSKHKNYKPQFFSNQTKVERRLSSKYSKDKREIKYITDTDFTANTWICGNYMVMIVTHQRPFYLIEINDQMISHNNREIFKKLWDVINE